MTDELNTIAELKDRLDDIRVAMVSTVDERGTISSRPMTIQEITDDVDLWFLVSDGADWLGPANGGPVNASITNSRTWVSFAGRAEVSTSPIRIAELMDEMSETFLGDDAQPVVLRLATDRIEWWAAPNKAAQVFQIAKAKITNQTPDMGASGTIET